MNDAKKLYEKNNFTIITAKYFLISMEIPAPHFNGFEDEIPLLNYNQKIGTIKYYEIEPNIWKISCLWVKETSRTQRWGSVL